MMFRPIGPARWRCLALAAILAALSARGQGQAADRGEHRPQALILAVDVSLSMSSDWKIPANDPDGLRWVGIEMAIDVADPNDRVALVVFRGKAVTLTRYIDDSGFVRIGGDYPGGKGRDVLKKLMSALRNAEAAAEVDYKQGKAPNNLPYFFDPGAALAGLAPRPAIPVNLSDQSLVGTSIYHALEAIADDGLGLLKPFGETQKRVLLFTDGQEEVPPALNPREGREYLDNLAPKFEVLARRFRLANVPIFTFGLGRDCDGVLLTNLAKWSQPEGASDTGVASYHHATDAPKLVDSLVEVIWQLRRYWISHAKPSRDSIGRVVLTTPIIGLEKNFGILVYREVPAKDADGRDRATIVAPTTDALTIDAIHDPVTERVRGVVPRVARSHLFYAFDKDSGDALRIGGNLQIKMTAGDQRAGDYKAVAVARTNDELFRYDLPVQGSIYTPKDEIPFAIAYLGGTDRAYRADQFTIDVALRKLDARGNVAKVAIPIKLDPPPPVPDGFAARPRSFTKGHVLDDSPDSKGLDLKGTYVVDVTITAMAGPLQGASRRFIRRTIEIGDYPRLKPGPEVVLSNDRGGSTGVASVSLDLKTEPRSSVARLSAKVVSKPGAGFSQLKVEPRTSGTVGRTQEFQVTAPAAFWSGLNMGEHRGGVVQVTSPWSKGEPAEVAILVRKSTLAILAPDRVQVAFTARDHDLAKRSARVTIPASLATDLEVDETAKLLDPEATVGGQPAKLTFRDGAGNSIALAATGLDSVGKLRGGSHANPTEFTLSLNREGDLRKGRYSRKFDLAGDSLTKKSVEVEVVIDEPEVYAMGLSGKYERITYLIAPGLAGTHLRRSLKIQSSLGTYEVRGLTVKPDHPKLLGLRDELTEIQTPVTPGTGGEFVLDLVVPSRVVEGPYQAKLGLAGETKLGDAPFTAFYLPLVVNVQVSHRGVWVKEGTDLKLPVPAANSTTASAVISLASNLKNAPIRWTAELIDAPTGSGKPAGPGIDVLAADDKGQFHNVLSRRSAANPILADGKAIELKVVADGRGLAPGLYDRTVRFHASDAVGGEPGAPFDLRVFVTVPGRIVHAAEKVLGASEVGRDSAEVGRGSEWTVWVESFGCDAGTGSVMPLDSWGTKLDAIAAVPDRPGHFAFKLKPNRAGPNKFLLQWDRLAQTRRDEPAPPDKQVKIEGSKYVQEITLSASCLIASWAAAVDPLTDSNRPDVSTAMKTAAVPVIQPGEDVVVRALAPVGSGTLHARAVNRAVGEKAQPIELLDDGNHDDLDANDGIYAAKYAGFVAEGRYEIILDGLPNGSAAVPRSTVEVGFRIKKAAGLERGATLASIRHGGGAMMGWLFSDYGVARRPASISIRNNRKSACIVTVRPFYPTTDEGSTLIVESDPEGKDRSKTRDMPRTENPEGGHHVLVAVTAPNVNADDSSRLAPGACAFSLEPGQEAALDLVASLPPEALRFLDTGESAAGVEPKVFTGPRGSLLHIRLDWPDKVSREILAPIRLRTSPLGWVWAVGILIGVAIAAVSARFVALPLWRKHKATLAARADETHSDPGADPRAGGLFAWLRTRLAGRRPDSADDLEDD